MTKMQAPEKGVTVRMYCLGHGDCFLLAFPRQGGGDPVYVLIDCGYKPGSPDFLNKIHTVDAEGNHIEKVRSIDDTVNHITNATGGHLDLVIMTHEHQDHLNGFWKEVDPYFQNFEIEQAWLAWTEDPNDQLANDLRKRYKDQLLGLVKARNQLAVAVGVNDMSVGRLDRLLSLEFGGEGSAFDLQGMLAVANDPTKSANKQGMKLIKDKAFERSGVQYLRPGEKIWPVPGSAGARAFVLGPPHSENLLSDEAPVGSELFPLQDLSSHSLSFSAAVQGDPGQHVAPFDECYCIPADLALTLPFFQENYGGTNDGIDERDNVETPPNPPWRRIDEEWLYSAENLALKLNTGLNNTSLVLAFELTASKKILLFPGDAQRGNWISWNDYTWKDGDETITARELLNRTVLYKVGHHGSQNATLAGKVDDDYPNLSWMGIETLADEFTAMIPAVNQWAVTKNNPPWYHPLPSIKNALEQKAQGRVIQMDESGPVKPADTPDALWNKFLNRVKVDELFFEFSIVDE
jgi:hypothetical protein